MAKAPAKAKGGKKADDAASSTSAGEPGADQKHELHVHSDGSAHTVTHDGTTTQHPSVHHALMHLAHHSSPGHHLAVEHHGGGMSSTHHVHEDGAVQGPHDHENIEALKDHLGKFFNEEESEGSGGYGGGAQDEGATANMGSGSLY
jgi:hypothetical protein